MYQISTIPLIGIREPFSSLSHLLGACAFVIFGILLVRRGRGDRLRMISLTLMACVSLQTLVLSTLYHTQWPGPAREFLLRADVAGIFLLIAGCITPVQIILFRGMERWLPLSVAWTAALLGMTLRLIYFDYLPSFVGIAIFLIFGWGGAVTAAILWQRYGWRFVKYAVFGGLSYTVGAVILLNHGPTLINGVVGPHELWHLSVLAGLGLHWRFVFQFASGHLPTAARDHLPPDASCTADSAATVAFPQPHCQSRHAA